MLARVTLRVLIAIALLLQGFVGATAALAASPGHHHCHSSMGHDGQAPKCPCCPKKAIGMSCADLCGSVVALPASALTFHAPVASISLPFGQTRLVAVAIDMLLRPPIS